MSIDRAVRESRELVLLVSTAEVGSPPAASLVVIRLNSSWSLNQRSR
jgi:hypothetical protein